MADDLQLEQKNDEEIGKEKNADVSAMDDASEGDPLEGRPDLQKKLIDLYVKCKGEDRYARLVEVKDVKRAEFYWAGRQYIWWSQQDQRYNLPTQQATNYGDLNIDDMPRFEFVTNIYQARGLMVIGSIAGAPPKIRFFPEDAEEQDDIEAAEGRTKLAKLIQRWNPVQKSLQEEAYHAYTGGFIAWWSRYVSNGEKYGIDSVQTMEQGAEEIESTILCPNCGWSAPANEAEPPLPCPICKTPLTEENITEEEPIPVPEDGQNVDVPKGRQVISPYGALNCCRPQQAKEQSQYHYFGLEEEIHYSTIRAAFPKIADKIKAGLNLGSDDAFERNARLSVAENAKMANQTSANQANLCTFVRCWFRPTAFWMEDDKDIRNDLIQLFPRGCKVEFSGTVYCKSEAQSMDDAIVTTHALPGPGQHRPAIGTSLLSVQDRVNTFSNIEAETYEYGIPITYRASDTFASEADDEQRAAPGLEIEIALQPNQNVQNRIMQLRADSVSPDMYEHSKELQGPVADQLTGTYPALTGAGADQGAPDTLGQQSMQHDQAMGRMGIFYVNLKQAHADVMTISCRDFEAHSSGIVKIPVLGASGDFESESVDVTALEGEAEAYPEGDESFPDDWNRQRATMMTVMDSPYGAKLIDEPENADLFGKLTGIGELKIPGVDAKRKQLKEISELTKPPQGDGMLGPIAPMVEVDKDTDEHEIEAKTCKNWLNSGPGQKLKRENPLGWQAVKEHMMTHLAAIPPPPPPMKPANISTTTSFKDMPPEAQAQWLEKEYGIKVDPNAFVQGAQLERLKKEPLTPKPAPGQPHQGAPPAKGEPPNGEVGGM